MMSISVTGRNLGIASHHPSNHRFQGLSGTRQMDGYTGHIMSLASNDRGLTPIEISLSKISEKMFMLGEFIPKKYKHELSKYSARFRFISKYLHKYYGDSDVKDVCLPRPGSIFASIVEFNSQPLEMKKVLADKKFGLTNKDVMDYPTFIDDLLKLYTDTEAQMAEIYNDLLKQCPYRSLDQNLHTITDPAKRFWKFLSAYQYNSIANLVHWVEERTLHKNSDWKSKFFKKTLTNCLNKEKNLVPLYKFMQKNDNDQNLGTKEKHIMLKWSIDQARISIKDAIEGKPYADLVNTAFQDVIKEEFKYY